MTDPTSPRVLLCAALGDSLRNYALQNGISREEVGRIIGVGPAYAFKLCRGHAFPGPDVQLRMRHRLGIAFDQLLDAAGDTA